LIFQETKMVDSQDLWVPGLGLVGDLLTFVGGFILAWDAAREEAHFRRLRGWAETFSSPQLVQLEVELGGIRIKSERDVELSFIRRSAKHAALGAGVLVLGFGLLLASRAVEIMGILSSH
jgi:hypothetical protein